jgi:chromosome segregation ATPase
MNDKELLQKIKNVRTAVKEIYGNVNTITYPIYMVEWLIEQAEKVEQLQKQLERKEQALEEMFQNREQWRISHGELEAELEQKYQEIEQLNNLLKIKESHEQQANNMVHLLEQQLQQTQAKMERYEKALKRIANHELFAETSFCDLEANELIYEAQEALEGTA